MNTNGYQSPMYNSPKAKKRPLRLLPLLAALALIIAIVVGVLLGIEASNHKKLVEEVESFQGVFLPNIYVDGICVSGMTPQEAIDTVVEAVNQRQNSWSTNLVYQGHTFATLNYQTLGIQTDIAEVYSLLQEAYTYGHRPDALEQNKQDYETFSNSVYQVYTTQTDLDTTLLDQMLSEIAAYFSRDPVDAYLVYFYPADWDNPFGIQPESYGYTLDVAPVREKILQMAMSGESGNIEMEPTIIAPKVTANDVRKTVTLIGEAITPVATSSTTQRTDNIRVALSRYHGLEVNPGETISFNKLVGERSMENGFQLAIEYANGLNAWGWGGGVCQASTTVYLAALHANLQIVNRTSHSDEVTYTEFGQDATVYYSSGRKIDFSFKNDTNSKIYIMARVEQKSRNNYQCVVRIYGQSLGDNVKYTLRTQTVETLPAPLMPEYQDDTQQQYVTYKDEEPYLLREARDGYINETYLQYWENGVLISEELISRDTCKARAALFLKGTKNRPLN